MARQIGQELIDRMKNLNDSLEPASTPAEPSTPAEGTPQGERTQAVNLMIDYATRYGFLLGGLEMVAAGHTTAEAVLARAREKYHEARAAADEWNWCIAPLYRSPTLTDAEREAIDWAAYAAEQWYEHTAAATLRGLLERTA